MLIFEGSFIYKNVDYYVCLFKIESDEDYYLIGVQNWELDINTGTFFRCKSKDEEKIIKTGFKYL